MRILDMTQTQYKVNDFLSWQRAGGLILSPSFQRRAVWSGAAKSYFIDTIVRGLPVPIIFLRELRDLKTLETKREVVDGQQRLRTIFAYVDPSCLPDFDERRDAFIVSTTHNKEIGGKRFSQLPDDTRDQILDYEFSTHVLPSGTDDRQVLEIFSRMNATGVRLNPQELRNAKYFGEFKSSMYELAYEQLPRWRSWEVFTENEIARMQEVETTSDFALLILNAQFTRRKPILDKAYKDYNEKYPDEKEVTRRFRATMDAIDDTLGRELRTMVFKGKGLFHTTFALFYDLLFGIGSDLARRPPRRLSPGLVDRIRHANDLIRRGEIPEHVAAAIERRTTDASERKTRLEFLRAICEHA